MRIYFFLLLLAACTTTPPRPPLSDVVLVEPKQKVSIPKYVIEKCPLVVKLEEKDYSKKELLDVAKQAITLYDNCRTKDSILVDAVKKAFNVDTSPTVVNKAQ